MSARQQPATDAQMGYIEGLTRRLRALLEDGDDIADQLDEASRATLSKRDASDLIQALIGALDRLGTPQTRKTEKGATVHELPISPSPGEIAASRERERRHAAFDAYDNQQRELHALHGGVGSGPRLAPTGRGRYLKIWKEYPNQAVRHHYWQDVAFGWRWKCTHPDHRSPVKGGSILGFDQTMTNAYAHWERRHA